MKLINEMNLLELTDAINENFQRLYPSSCTKVIRRMEELHDLTRWISVGERMPTEEDADEDGFIDCYGKYGRFPMRLGHIDNLDIGSKTFTHWRRIDKP